MNKKKLEDVPQHQWDLIWCIDIQTCHVHQLNVNTNKFKRQTERTRTNGRYEIVPERALVSTRCNLSYYGKLTHVNIHRQTCHPQTTCSLATYSWI